IDLGGYRELSGSVSAGFPLSGWTADVLEPKGGRVLSDEAELSISPGPGGQNGMFAGLRFNWPDKSKARILRLTPPSDATAPLPTIYWDLAAALGASSNWQVQLEIGFDPAAARKVQAVVLDAEGTSPQEGATVEFRARSIDGISTFVDFSVKATTDAAGIATVTLPPGSYDVQATPATDGELAIAKAQWTIHADKTCFCGHALALPRKAHLDGSVTVDQGGALAAVPVTAVPSEIAVASKLAGLSTMPYVTPRPESTNTDETGSFSMLVDVDAAFDVSVRPPATTGFPWLVLPQFLVPASGQVDASALADLVVPAPAVLRGGITDSSGAPIVGATLGAFLPVTSVDGTKDVVVQIGQTTTDASGNYELVLPASISQSP
ncbi:MAG TPA: Ig-like domain-containing protein, partial [Minicystis sp.]|nr:Ig-like domain-containing protein [Minicystis sp.]